MHSRASYAQQRSDVAPNPIGVAVTDEHPCLSYRCPFCGADPGTPCRSHRGRGPELKYPHCRRISIVHPAQGEVEKPPVQALCCDCGQLRTVSANFQFPYQDPNRPVVGYVFDDPRGWRETGTLKCETCGQRTRHALLKDPTRIDHDEKYQQYVLGSEWDGKYPPDLERLRQAYYRQFPRNPNLKHRFYIDAATQAWDRGVRTVTALCGAPDTIQTDPRTWGKSKKEKRQKDMYGGYVVAEQLSDIEYTDVDTGLEWIDIDCVDCCRVSNHLIAKRRRERLEWFLLRFATRPELVPDANVDNLMQTLEKWWGAVEG